MSRRTLNLTDELYEYMLGVSLREPEPMARLRQETARLDEARMQVSPEQGQFMRWLNEALGTRRALEVGVFTGYSSLCIALALPPDGRLVACDLSEEWTRIARRYWREVGVDERIDLRIGPALQTLDGLLASGQQGSFDFVFIDADKEAYAAYYERSFELVRPGGIIAFDNTLWSGRVADATDQEASTRGIRTLNDKLRADERISLSLIPIGDGLTLARRR